MDANFELLRSLSALLSAGVGYYFKMHRPRNIGRRSKSKDVENFEFMAGFMALDFKKRPAFLVENGFKIYFGKSLKYEEIIRLIETRNPLTTMQTFFIVRDMLCFEEGAFKFKPAYDSEHKRKREINFSGSFYFLLFLVGWLMFLHAPDAALEISPLTLLPLGAGSLLAVVMAFSQLDKIQTLRLASQFLVEIDKAPIGSSTEQKTRRSAAASLEVIS